MESNSQVMEAVFVASDRRHDDDDLALDIPPYESAVVPADDLYLQHKEDNS